MKKRRTQKTTDSIKTTTTKAVETVKETVEKAADKIVEETSVLAEAICTKISEVNVEIFETNVSLDAIEKAVKKEASDKKLKGDIKIYINAEHRTAFYTVNGEGAKDYKIDLRTL